MGTNLLLIGLLGCAPPPLGDTAVDTSPRISVEWPEPEADVVGCTLVVVSFENFVIHPFDPAVGDPPNVPGEGHWHAYWDQTYLGSYTPYLLVDMSNLPPNVYLITVQLEQNQHEAVLDDDGKPIQDTVPVNLVAGDCTASTSGLP